MRISPVGVVLVLVMVVGFVLGFLGRGEFAGFCLLVAGVILLYMGVDVFTRGGGRAGYGRRLIVLAEQAEEARRRERERKGEPPL